MSHNSFDAFSGLEPRLFLSGGFVLDHSTSPELAHRLAIADLDSDGDLDVAATHGDVNPTGLNIYLNVQGTLELSQHFDFDASQTPSLDVAATDYDGDGDLDLVALGFRLFLNEGGEFEPAILLRPETIVGTYFVADHNGDNLPDIYVQDSGTGAVTLHANISGDAADAGTVLPRVSGGQLIDVRDMDADGDADLVYFTSASISIFRRNPTGYDLPLTSNVALSYPPVIADLNADARPDLAWAAAGRLFTAMNAGNATFGTPTPSGTAVWSRVLAVDDFDADGVPDVAGINTAHYPIGIGVAFAREPGFFGDDVAHVLGYLPNFEQQPSAYAARINADDRADLLTIRRPGIAPWAGTLDIYRAVSAPNISAFITPPEPFIPGRVLRFDLTASPGDSGDVSAVTIYRDSNSNGVHDGADEIFANARRVTPGGNEWIADPVVGDVLPVGLNLFFAIAYAGSVRSDAGTVAVEAWLRTAYPEGWCNDATINEYVPIVNPNPYPVQYRLVAHYETGERDQVVAEGVIAPFTRGGVTISEHANPAGALVRLNEGYALELQSSAFLAATLSHYDSFTGVSGLGAATGEAFTNRFSMVWTFAHASTEDAAFLVLFNPTAQPAELSITLHDDTGASLTIQRTVEPFRRGGFALRDLGLTSNTPYAVLISSNHAVLAALSSYSLADGSGFTSLGRPRIAGNHTDVVFVELGDSLQNRVVLFNFSDSQADAVILRISFVDAGAPVTRSYLLNPLARRTIDLDALRPLGATGASLELGGDSTYLFAESIDASRGDSVAATPASGAFPTWGFADGFLDRNTAGTVGFETISILNPGAEQTSATIRFLFTDGTYADRATTIDAGGAVRLRLDQEDLVLDHDQLNFFSIMVFAEQPVVASMVHWDLFQGGGWATLGTPSSVRGIVG